jgi:hypothetical protein
MGSMPPNEPSLAVKRHVEDLFPTLESLFAAGDQVLSLVEHPGWDYVNRVLAAEVDGLDRRLDGMSNPLPHPEMCLMHGRRGGLKAATDAAQAILQVAAARREEQRIKHEGAAEPALRS